MRRVYNPIFVRIVLVVVTKCVARTSLCVNPSSHYTSPTHTPPTPQPLIKSNPTDFATPPRYPQHIHQNVKATNAILLHREGGAPNRPQLLHHLDPKRQPRQTQPLPPRHLGRL